MMITMSVVLALVLLPMTGDQAPTNKNAHCPALELPKIGEVDMCRRLYCEFNVKCPEGFWYTGTTPRVCQPNSSWSGQPGECKVVFCPALPELEHGKILQRNRSYSARAEVMCDEGYVYNKPEFSTRECLGNQSWSGNSGDCEALRCPVLPNVENGQLSKGSRKFRDTVILQCNSGYIMNGPDTATCGANGTWSVLPGHCKLHNSKNSLLPAILGSCLPALAVLVVIICLLIRFQHRLVPSQRRHHASHGFGTYPEPPLLKPQVIPLSGSERLYCSFILKNDLAQGFTKTEEHAFPSIIKEDIIRRIKVIMHFEVEVVGTVFCQSKRTCLFEVISNEHLEEKEVMSAIGKTDEATPYQIKSDTLRSREKALHFLLAEVLKKKHTVDKALDTSIDLENQYVRLKLLSQKSLTTMNRDKLERPDLYQSSLEKNKGQSIQDEDLITEQDSEKYILIRGRAGIGKSTLIQRLFWKWANGEWATKFKVIFLLNLRYLMTIDRPMDLSHLLSLYSTYNTGQSGQLIKTDWLNENQDKVGIVIDGIDEIQNFKDHWKKGPEISRSTMKAKPLEWCLALMKRDCLEKSSLIISSRPFADLSILEKDSKSEIMIVELMGLTRERAMEFVDRNATENKRDFVKQTLKKNPILLSVCAITFYCAALCQVLSGKSDEELNLNTYTQITAYIMKTYMERSMNSANAGSWEEKCKSVLSTLDLLSKLAYNGLLNKTGGGLPRLIFTKQDFDELKAEAPDLNAMRKVGLLMETHIRSPSDPKQETILSQFVHLSIQEFLAMAGLLHNDVATIQNSLRKLMKSDQFDMALLFLYGLALNGNDDTIKSVSTFEVETSLHEEKVLNILLEGVDGLSSEFQALQLAHESQSGDVAKKVGGKLFKEEVSIKGHKMTVIDVIAMLFILKHHKATHVVRLKHVDLDLVSVQQIAIFLKENNSMQTLELEDSGINDENVKHLMDGVRFSGSLKALSLSSDSIKDEGMISVASALDHNKTLQSFSLSSEAVTSVGLVKVADILKGNDSLQKLTLSTDGLTDDALEHIASVLRENKALAELILTSDEITDNGIKALATALGPHTHLRMLSVLSHKLSDKAIRYISNANKQTNTLTQLQLYGLHAGDEGAKTVLELLEVRLDLFVRMWPPRCSDRLKVRLDAHVRFESD